MWKKTSKARSLYDIYLLRRFFPNNAAHGGLNEAGFRRIVKELLGRFLSPRVIEAYAGLFSGISQFARSTTEGCFTVLKLVYPPLGWLGYRGEDFRSPPHSPWKECTIAGEHLPTSIEGKTSRFANACQNIYVSSFTVSEGAAGHLLQQLRNMAKLIWAGK